MIFARKAGTTTSTLHYIYVANTCIVHSEYLYNCVTNLGAYAVSEFKLIDILWSNDYCGTQDDFPIFSDGVVSKPLGGKGLAFLSENWQEFLLKCHAVAALGDLRRTTF